MARKSQRRAAITQRRASITERLAARFKPTRENAPFLIGVGVGAVGGFLYFFGRPAIGAARIPVPPGFIPVTILVKGIGNGQTLRTDAAWRFKRMQAAAKKDGVTLTANSGFRSIPKQAVLYAQHLIAGGFKAASLKNLIAEVSNPGFQTTIKPSPPTAPPGRSSHNVGIAVDIDVGLSMADYAAGRRTKTFSWLEVNAGKFGFQGPLKTDQGVEPWHFSLDGR